MSNTYRKTRTWTYNPTGLESSSYTWYVGSSFIESKSFNQRVTCRQTTTWEQTLWPESRRLIADLERSNKSDPSAKRLRQSDLGGDFRTERTDAQLLSQRYDNLVVNDGSSIYRFTGHFEPGLSTLTSSEGASWPTVSSVDLSNLIGIGSSAIAKCSPANSAADAATATGELLRDGIPNWVGATLLRDRSHFFKSLGSEYLNVEFGWKPFISDFRKLLKSVSEYEKILGQYRRDSGKLIRRQYSFPTIEENGPLYDQQVQVNPALQSAMFADPNGLARQIGYRFYTKQIWFSGAFQYWLASGSNRLSAIERKAQEANHLLGLRLTPDVLWELEPWSWFVDWFTNMGDVFANLSRGQTDNQVMRYGYVMGDYHIRDEHSSYGLLWKNGQRSGLSSFTRGNRVKIRTKATPFGFGLDPATDFTARQWAIIGALGLSRGDRVAW